MHAYLHYMYTAFRWAEQQILFLAREARRTWSGNSRTRFKNSGCLTLIRQSGEITVRTEDCIDRVSKLSPSAFSERARPTCMLEESVLGTEQAP